MGVLNATELEAASGAVTATIQAVDQFLPIITRAPAGRNAAARVGMYVGTSRYNGVTDPTVAIGYFAPPGELSSSFQLEGAWDVGAGGVITEMYWQIVKANGQSRRPMFGKYNAVSERTVSWQFMIGNGLSDTGAADPTFSVNWDDDTGPVGVGCFRVSPNRLSIYAVSTGGIAADEVRLRLYSAAAKGTAIAMTYNGQDAEGYSNPTLLFQTVSLTQVNFAMRGTYMGEFNQRSATQCGLGLTSGIKLGDGTNTMRAAMWASTGAPSSGMGANGDWCISDNGSLYFKSAGAWSVKV